MASNHPGDAARITKLAAHVGSASTGDVTAPLQYVIPTALPRGRQIPLSTAGYLLVAVVVGVAANQYPDVVAPVSLALATFLTLERLHRSIH